MAESFKVYAPCAYNPADGILSSESAVYLLVRVIHFLLLLRMIYGGAADESTYSRAGVDGLRERWRVLMVLLGTCARFRASKGIKSWK